MKRLFALAACALVAQFHTYAADIRQLTYTPAPPDNPLKGFMPYSGSYTTFPYSLEWFYLPVNSVMTGSNQFNWTALESKLNAIAARGNHAIFRFYLDYPTETTGIPQYLLNAGLVTRSYNDYDNNGVSVSPDYENPLLRSALTNFIHRLGTQYDGDPRIGFITVGLLGFWGEWHTYPYWDPPNNWFASVAVQDEVLNAYQTAFTKTRFLLRQPHGTNPGSRPMGYHDDSFAYSTIDPPEWHFLGTLKAAGETNKWRTQPIGGEIRPEIQSCLWDANTSGCPIPAQNYNQCVDMTHATWMLNHEAFEPGFNGTKKDRAIAGAQRLGYEFHVTNVTFAAQAGTTSIGVALRNRGIAPFYHDWPVELAALLDDGTIVRTWTTPWTLRGLLPSATNTVWSIGITNAQLPQGVFALAMRAVNPLTNGKALKFANATQDQHRNGWLTLGRFQVKPPRLEAGLQGDGSVKLLVNGSLPSGAAIQKSADLQAWNLFQTNLPTTNWFHILPTASLTNDAFFRLDLPPL
ncbi:MAG TPA: DUF4832 domain-containing protein [Verrucomicrobiota bacterium]|nr:DUF4832 domain-containing protein [Verrucomicrobiota bacterium]